MNIIHDLSHTIGLDKKLIKINTSDQKEGREEGREDGTMHSICLTDRIKQCHSNYVFNPAAVTEIEQMKLI